MPLEDRIVVDPRLLAGKPALRGSRISVEFILTLLAEGWTDEEILDNYPQLEREDLLAVLKYTSDTRST